ncbi:MAG: sigma-70 family RNA polymerase sigma factor [Eubacteriales bacterium]|nr:sigma-70 family RNA polymerase sigma factor [Eubacteriales bacterium]
MDDQKIIDLYWSRSESAISESNQKYGKYCYSIAYNILTNNEDAEECVSDTYMAAWKAMPPQRPSILATFLGKITRNLSIDRWRSRSRYKRGGGEIILALEELEECVSDSQTVEKAYEQKLIALVFNRFLESLQETERQIFLCRYWYLDSIADIANYYGFSNSKVTSMLYRTRKKLRAVLKKEDLL